MKSFQIAATAAFALAVSGCATIRGGPNGDELCFWWGNAPRECWPYPAPFERGRSRSLTSDRGNQVTVTLL